MMTKSVRNITIWILVIFVYGCSEHPRQKAGALTTDLHASDTHTVVGQKSFLAGYEPMNPDGSINVVVEIPAGTTAKWEVSKPDGHLKWEIRNGRPRVVNYLGYPGNYGMIPRTLLPKELGGDGDPLDVIVLGPAVPRGTVIRARVIGVLKLLDGGEQDDKLVGVMADTPFYQLDNLNELNEEFRGVTTIIETWFANYKGSGEMESAGFGDAAEATQIVNQAISAYGEEPATY